MAHIETPGVKPPAASWAAATGRAHLDIQIIEPNITHTLAAAQLRAWLDRPPTSPAESVRKQK